MSRMKDESLELVVTSPPYWNQRYYDADLQIFDDVEGCEHHWISLGKASSSINTGTSFYKKMKKFVDKKTIKHGYVCYHCEAYKSQLGMEKFLEDGEIEVEMMEIKDDLTTEELQIVLDALKEKL
jgi:hypothetical protein